MPLTCLQCHVLFSQVCILIGGAVEAGALPLVCCINLPTRLRLCIQDVLEDREDTPDQIDGWLQDQ